MIYGAKVSTIVLPIIFALGVLGILGMFFVFGTVIFGITLITKFAIWMVLLPLQIVVWFFRGLFGIIF